MTKLNQRVQLNRLMSGGHEWGSAAFGASPWGPVLPSTAPGSRSHVPDHRRPRAASGAEMARAAGARLPSSCAWAVWGWHADVRHRSAQHTRVGAEMARAVQRRAAIVQTTMQHFRRQNHLQQEAYLFSWAQTSQRLVALATAPSPVPLPRSKRRPVAVATTPSEPDSCGDGAAAPQGSPAD